MKIAWFTPFSKKSAIGKYSQIITDELKNYCDVDLWVPQSDDLLVSNLNIRTIFLQTELFIELTSYDLCVFNLGDHLDNHLDIYEISKKVKGVVILHDFIMHHFFLSYYLSYKNKPEEYIREMGRLYGQIGRENAVESLNGTCVPIWETDYITKYPFFEKAIEGALGIITHSHFLADMIKSYTTEMVKLLYFPNCFSGENIPIPTDMADKLALNGNKLLLLTVGHVNSNKRIDKFISMLGKNRKLAEAVRYVVIGPYEENAYFKEINDLIKTYNLNETVCFMGYQPDHVLHAFMQQADVMINLRFPAMEGASWSLLEQLSIGKPIVVTDNGFYSELLCEGLVKTNPLNELNDLDISLDQLCTNKELREQMGVKSKEFYRDNFNTDKYCKEFIEFSNIVISRKPIVNLIDKVAEELFLMDVNVESLTSATIATEIHNLLC